MPNLLLIINVIIVISLILITRCRKNKIIIKQSNATSHIIFVKIFWDLRNYWTRDSLIERAESSWLKYIVRVQFYKILRRVASEPAWLLNGWALKKNNNNNFNLENLQKSAFCNKNIQMDRYIFFKSNSLSPRFKGDMFNVPQQTKIFPIVPTTLNYMGGIL